MFFFYALCYELRKAYSQSVSVTHVLSRTTGHTHSRNTRGIHYSHNVGTESTGK